MKQRETTISLKPTNILNFDDQLCDESSLFNLTPLKSSPIWSKSNVVVKRGFDIIFSLIGLIILAPFIPLVVWRIKKDSDGSAFYKQERIGKNGQPFLILKFRTMFLDAEKDGPALSSRNDERITRFGRFLRKWRIDETPQFINVLKGEMTLIGPRPERQYYIEQLAKTEPAFHVLLKVKPGITSLGMVKFGYAENQEQMLKRLKYELLYMKNYSLWLDFMIFLYTLRTLVCAEGK